MSQQERNKLEGLKRAQDKVICPREAAERMGMSERWVRKRLQRMRRQGDAAVVHGRRGRASNRKIATGLQARAIEILKQPEWQDFGPAFAAQQFGKRPQIRARITTQVARAPGGRDSSTGPALRFGN